ncbi:BPSL1445 family SYLF domain-containing lipoprotein [Roseateles violae]|uniref:YSC84-related protein n=1 Tax=Roseateles violae TaxID=3058042 RepID=A0ABT8DR35_9BURK|nr:YSC84-related protein [Pelomonas sp. PFR6]MDN3920498.1 YSC84-related protein [Pelomonas sp. PFR6]
MMIERNKRNLLILACAALLGVSGCTTTGPNAPADPASKRASIDAAVDAALSKLYNQVPGSREMVARSVGVLVFPGVVSAGLGIGGSYGQGALRVAGRSEGYYSTTAASVGLIAGADSKAMYVLFMNQESFDKFRASKGWTAGVDASVTLIKVGADAGVDTQTGKQPVVGYVLSNAGLMANLSIDGTKVSRLDI